MTQLGNTTASPTLSPTSGNRNESESELDGRSVRARTERMTVSPLGDALYEVETDDTTYLVDLSAKRCSCPDHTFRGVRCKHLRRVAIEITEGRVPAPGEAVVECAICGDRLFADVDADPPHYCEAHDLRPGSVVRDRESGARVLVVSVSERRADRVRVGDSAYSVATYPTNREYDPADSVVGAVYPESVMMTDTGPDPERLRVYAFPRSRLEVLD